MSIGCVGGSSIAAGLTAITGIDAVFVLMGCLHSVRTARVPPE